MASIASAVERFKRNPSILLDPKWITDACEFAEYRWRDRVFNPVITMHLFMIQVLSGNCSVRRMLRIAKIDADDQCYNAARKRIPLDVFGYLAADVTNACKSACDEASRWLGHRVMMIDGSGLSMPDTAALRSAFGLPGNVKDGCGFPVMHTLWMMDMATGLIRDFVTGRWNIHDMKDACRLHGNLEKGDVVIGDRAFGLFTHLVTLQQLGLHGVCRINQKITVSFKVNRRSSGTLPKAKRKGKPRSEYVRRLGHLDQVVRYLKPKKRPASMSAEQFAAMPETMLVRELRYTVGPRGRSRQVTLMTTLLDAEKYPKAELARLYGLRWRVETNLRHLKQTLGMNVLRCQTVDGVNKEVWVYVMIFNLICREMVRAASRQKVEPDRISFIDTLDVMHHSPELLGLVDILVNPWRPGRDEPRVVKRRKDCYRYMTRPREELRQELGIKRPAA